MNIGYKCRGLCEMRGNLGWTYCKPADRLYSPIWRDNRDTSSITRTAPTYPGSAPPLADQRHALPAGPQGVYEGIKIRRIQRFTPTRFKQLPNISIQRRTQTKPSHTRIYTHVMVSTNQPQEQQQQQQPSSPPLDAAPYPLRRPKSTSTTISKTSTQKNPPFPTPIQRTYSAGPQPSWDYTIPTRYMYGGEHDGAKKSVASTADAERRRRGSREAGAVEEQEYVDVRRRERVRRASASDAGDDGWGCFGCLRGWRRRGGKRE